MYYKKVFSPFKCKVKSKYKQKSSNCQKLGNF